MKILIIRFSSIGDIVLITPVINQLREKYPDATIDFLVLSNFVDAINFNQNLDRVIEFDKEIFLGVDGIYKFSKKLDYYDIVIDLHSKIRSILITFFLKKGKVFRYKKRGFFENLAVKLKVSKYSPKKTIIQRYFEPLKSLGVKYKNENLYFGIDNESLNRVNKFIHNFGNYVVFAPGASKETKKWPKDNFKLLANLIYNKFKYKIILLSNKKEYNELEYIKDGREFIINMAGKLSLKESGAVMANSKFVVANDSGPFHIARAVGVKTFVFFGPTSPKMFEFDGNTTLFFAGVECSPCSLHGDKECPKKHFNCMKKIDVDYVLKQIEEYVHEKR